MLFVSSMFDKIRSVLKRTSDIISAAVHGNSTVNQDLYDNIEDSLILADVGVDKANYLVNLLKKQKFFGDDAEIQIKKYLAQQIEKILQPYEGDFFSNLHTPEIILIVGVNGNGKTTTIAKLAHNFQQNEHKPMVVAADTFRAAAVEQLSYWANKLGIHIHKGKEGTDAAGLVFDAVEQVLNKSLDNDVVIIDTAGRMQNRRDLLDELIKIKRVIKKLDPVAPHRTILVLDGLTGQAVHNQVEVFHNEIGVDGIIITKLDATAKGGAIVALTQKYRIPIFAVGIGESIDDLQTFNAKRFSHALMGLDIG